MSRTRFPSTNIDYRLAWPIALCFPSLKGWGMITVPRTVQVVYRSMWFPHHLWMKHRWRNSCYLHTIPIPGDILISSRFPSQLSSFFLFTLLTVIDVLSGLPDIDIPLDNEILHPSWSTTSSSPPIMSTLIQFSHQSALLHLAQGSP